MRTGPSQLRVNKTRPYHVLHDTKKQALPAGRPASVAHRIEAERKPGGASPAPTTSMRSNQAQADAFAGANAKEKVGLLHSE